MHQLESEFHRNVQHGQPNGCLRMIPNKISSKSSRRLTSMYRILLLASAIICSTICLIGKSTLCDNNSQISEARSAVGSQATSLQQSISSSNINQKRNHNKASAANHKEHLLSYLSDNIERQHFKMKPPRAFVHQRPSKFDSGDDLNEIFMSQPINSYNHRGSNPKSAADKVDQGMRHIMRMHEQVGHQHPTNTASSSTASDSSSSSSSSSAATSGSNFVNKWRDISRAPARVASNLINPGKMMTQVLSYISPLIGASKLIDSPTLLNQKTTGQNLTGLAGSTLVSRLRLNPFTGRSINDQPSIDSIFGFERNKVAQGSSVTQTPQTAYLVKPDLFKYSSGANSLQFTTPSASLFEALMGEPSSSSSDKDLEADSSSSSASLIEGNDLKTKGDNDNEAKQQAKSILGPNGAGRNWLKNSANQFAQNYLQNSFRGLLTLSQLPISPTGSASSAPSEQEKNRVSLITKLKNAQMNHKHPAGQHKPNQNQSSTAESQRRRALDELYRYAYILSLGIGRKRDPLMALASKPPPRSSIFKQKQGAFSQRSKGILSSIQNQKQMLDYTKALKSLLTPNALNKAKPRGVMWDMATDPSLVVTVFHLLERASVALPLGR